MTKPTTAGIFTLTKEDGAADLDGVTKMGIGASWDTTTGGSGALLGALRKARGTDLDVFAILMSGNDPVRYAGLDVTDPLQNGAVTSTGDNQTGHGDGDDELIEVTFDKIPSNVTSIVFVCAAYKRGSDFRKAASPSRSTTAAAGPRSRSRTSGPLCWAMETPSPSRRPTVSGPCGSSRSSTNADRSSRETRTVCFDSRSTSRPPGPARPALLCTEERGAGAFRCRHPHARPARRCYPQPIARLVASSPHSTIPATLSASPTQPAGGSN